MRNKNKDKIEVYLTEEKKAEVKAFSRKNGITMAEVLKRAIDLILK